MYSGWFLQHVVFSERPFVIPADRVVVMTPFADRSVRSATVSTSYFISDWTSSVTGRALVMRLTLRVSVP
jgi:hypothetical protein